MKKIIKKFLEENLKEDGFKQIECRSGYQCWKDFRGTTRSIWRTAPLGKIYKIKESIQEKEKWEMNFLTNGYVVIAIYGGKNPIYFFAGKHDDFAAEYVLKIVKNQ